jgi:hypothetical protein
MSTAYFWHPHHRDQRAHDIGNGGALGKTRCANAAVNCASLTKEI